MKKILFAALFVFGAVGGAQAAGIDGETSGTTKYTVVGFGTNDVFQADSNSGATTVVLTDNGTPVASQTAGDLSGVADGFIHDYVFTAIQTGLFSIQSVSETGSGGNIINPLILEVWNTFAGPGNDVLIGTDTMTQVGATSREASVAAMFVAGQDYVVRLSNEGGTIGSAPDYSLEMSQVPVPAAVWLFGTAMVGLLGLRRKSKMAAAA